MFDHAIVCSAVILPKQEMKIEKLGNKNPIPPLEFAMVVVQTIPGDTRIVCGYVDDKGTMSIDLVVGLFNFHGAR